jgi:hypothetical protein
MFAMTVLLALYFRAATIAVLMATHGPETFDAASEGTKRSGGCQAGNFLASRGMGEAQGKKVERRHCG